MVFQFTLCEMGFKKNICSFTYVWYSVANVSVFFAKDISFNEFHFYKGVESIEYLALS